MRLCAGGIAAGALGGVLFLDSRRRGRDVIGDVEREAVMRCLSRGECVEERAEESVGVGVGVGGGGVWRWRSVAVVDG